MMNSSNNNNEIMTYRYYDRRRRKVIRCHRPSLNVSYSSRPMDSLCCLSLSILLLLFVHQQSSSSSLLFANAWSTPVIGLGSALFRFPPKNLITQSAQGEPKVLLEASDFFVDAFWVSKVGGGAAELSPRQRKSLSNTQFMEFRGRYAGVQRGNSELVTCQLPNTSTGDGVIGCVGISVSPIPKDSLTGLTTMSAPLMSNLAVSRAYRRRGIGELLVEEAERIAKYEWGMTEVYLYVEARNIPAVKLYRKLGYRTLWTDDNAKTLLPNVNGNLQNVQTKLVCMRKRLDLGFFDRFWPF